MSLVPVLIFGSFFVLCALIVIGLCQAAKETAPAIEVHDERLTCLPITDVERGELFVEAEAITREACYR